MAELKYLTGDATKPVQTPAYIVHICNNKGGWGAGFVVAVTKNLGRGPEASYRLWSREAEGFRLGKIQIVTVDSNISVVNMIAQDGYGTKENNFKPLHLKALRQCLKQVYAST
ncbi:MAG: Appr-1-p processing protein, partial [Candidatus Nanoarchaeia archaeon]|nr:Appr-1-p processing protein [Candidatus Nanoarchaeia archaeon]